MKQFRKGILSIVCTLALLYTLVIPAQAADPMFYDCVLYLFGFNDVPEVVTQSVAIQVQAADGSGGVWAVASVQVTQGATQYIAANPSDSGSNAYAELIASDPDSGIAVFRLDGQITSRSAPTIQTLDGLSAGDSVAVAGISAAIVGTLTPLNGFNMSEAENLLLYGADMGLKLSGLLVCGVLIAALGAVMDTSMNIASAMWELREHKSHF